MANDKLIIHFKLIDYWIDYKNKKAYCIIYYTHIPDKYKESNLHLIESDYNDN